ncbi:MAG: (d)CMP kinase [Sedimentisphaerales bacterium]|nr:(d)CMP kinase [Sedimentisphaerales bacterium]
MANLVITIDGPAASGKSTVARLLAQRIGANFLDTGAMYRAVTLAAVKAGLDLEDEEELIKVLDDSKFNFRIDKTMTSISIDGLDVTEEIRKPDITANTYYIASSPKVRAKLVQMQRVIATDKTKIVTEGRDQGSVAFPEAAVKFYLTASLDERARRRLNELRDKGYEENSETIKAAIEARDKSDSGRDVGPLVPPKDAVIIDTTNLTAEEVVEQLIGRLKKRPTLEFKPSRIWIEIIQIKGQKIWYWLARWACRLLCLFAFHLRFYGTENIPDKGGFLLVSNHQSYLDPIFCGVGLKRHLFYLARDSLFDNRFFGWLLGSVNTIPVKRDKADLSSIRKVIAKLSMGQGVCLFPEGTRSIDGKIAPFKAGFGLLARRAKVAVVPVLIDGAFECWPRHRRIFTPGSIVVCFGRTIKAEQLNKMSDRDLAKYLTDKLKIMQCQCRTKQGKISYDYQPLSAEAIGIEK